MNVFISWSGERSGAAAEALRDWLPQVINALRPWLSVADMDKGARWGNELAAKLKDAKAGIICLTPSNVHSDWLLFEAGALSKAIENTYVCPLLIGLEPADVKPPLAQFQATRATKSEILKLLRTLNNGLGEAARPTSQVDEAFEVWWPKLESRLNDLPADDAAPAPQRTERDLIEEILSLVRNQDPAYVPNRPSKSSGMEVLRVLQSLDRAVTSISYLPRDRKIGSDERVYDVTADSRGYKIRVPNYIPPDQLSEILGPQIRTCDTVVADPPKRTRKQT